MRDGGWSWKLSALLSADQLHSWLGTDCETRLSPGLSRVECGEGWTHRKSIICARWYYGSHPSEPTVRAARYGLPCRPRQAGCRAAAAPASTAPHASRATPRAPDRREHERAPRPTLTSSLPRPLQREDLGLPCSSSDRGLHSRLYWEEVRCRASRVAAADTRRCVGMDMSSGGQLRAPQVGAQVHREHGAAPWLSGLHVPLVTSPHSRTSTANNDQRPKTERYH